MNALKVFIIINYSQVFTKAWEVGYLKTILVKFVIKLPLASLRILIYTLLANDFQTALGYGIFSIVSLRHA